MISIRYAMFLFRIRNRGLDVNFRGGSPECYCLCGFLLYDLVTEKNRPRGRSNERSERVRGNMFLRNSSFAAVLSLAFSAPVVAAPVEIDFSFDIVAGTFYGLDDSDGTSQASSFDLIGDADDYLNVDAATADKNEFTFDAGELTEVHFEITGPIPGENGTGDLVSFAIVVNRGGLFGPTNVIETSGSARSSVFSEPDLRVRPATVPLPAGPLLLFTGIAAIGGLRFRKKRVGRA